MRLLISSITMSTSPIFYFHRFQTIVFGRFIHYYYILTHPFSINDVLLRDNFALTIMLIILVPMWEQSSFWLFSSQLFLFSLVAYTRCFSSRTKLGKYPNQLLLFACSKIESENRIFRRRVSSVEAVTMAPHGPGFTGALHSHNPEYPDDNWNLYAMIDTSTTTALNVTRPSDAVGIFKPFVHRLTAEPEIISDADEEIIVIVRFTSPVHIRKLMIIGGGEEEQHPSHLKCYANHENLDFTSIGSVRPSQEFNLVLNPQGTVELTTLIHPFTNVTSLTFYFPSNHGSHATTVVKYIGMQGEHTHYRREAVDTVYEALCNGQDIVQPEGVAGAESGLGHHMH